MKRILLAISSLFLFTTSSFANHITGGEMYYTLIGQSGNSYQYEVTLKLFRDPNSGGAQLDASAAIAVFDRGTGGMVWNSLVPKTSQATLLLTSPGPCINNPPHVEYQVGFYVFTVTLPAASFGYTIVYQRCCRIAGINNLSGSSAVGTSYTAEIPGTNPIPTAPANNSARFVGPDTVIVCANNSFTYSFAALDPDPEDNLVYSFCNAFIGGSQAVAAPNPPEGPPYAIVPYVSPFDGSFPLGPGVTLNTATGLISGIAPAAGIYVVTVCVSETRNGIVIAVQRKDLQIKVGDCDIAKADLNPQYISCDSLTLNFRNLSTSSLIGSYFWDFGVTTATNDTSDLATPTFKYPDTGTYVLKLVTNRNQECSDSTTAIVKVYPGFFPGFTTTGDCFTSPFQFKDTTRARYGFVNSWDWNFGDLSTSADVSFAQNPSWTYSSGGNKDVTFIVTSSKGCADTIHVTVAVLDKPVITLAFKDTLICKSDAVTLTAAGTGVINWSPPISIINPGTASPTVNPPSTTVYYIDLDNNGCKSRDSVKVRVVDSVTLKMMNDTTICRGDAVQLMTVSDGLQFTWTPATNLDRPDIISPIAKSDTAVTYQVIAFIGSCSATDQVIVKTAPYPGADAGKDPTVCYNTSGQLTAAIAGTVFSWSPVSYLNNAGILNPVSSPPRTTQYVLTVYDTLGCPKPGRDTVVVFVLPRVRAFAGRDTTVVIGQPLQLIGSGGVSYLWSPATGLSDVNIFNPIATYGPETDFVKYKLVVRDQSGCGDSAFVTVTVFKTNPYVFVPTAFTPNGDGLNDVISPIAVGIQKINYFSIYNRWGQLLFTTTINGKGWDGRVGGTLQNTGVFVWMVSAVDYTDKPLFLKGTVTLIR